MGEREKGRKKERKRKKEEQTLSCHPYINGGKSFSLFAPIFPDSMMASIIFRRSKSEIEFRNLFRTRESE
jgi:hypothetical protein